ncbi:uncharacterized protein pprc1 [Aplochiton taeniatus]
MAARWGAGEDILTVSNMDYFSTNTLDEMAVMSQGSVDSLDLDSAETLETLQGCLDPSILSIFEDAPTGEVKGLDEESEATLLTALTEILDNVDDENLSPFDTLPDSDLLSGQKGREHSPLRKLLCLSRSPPEKDPARAFSTGKSLPRIQLGSIQRSDGEEEEDSLSPSSRLSPQNDELLDWGGLSLPLPLCLDQEGEDSDGLSVSLGDLIRHMHPYCMAVCVEDGEGEHMLPEGGILLEVVDQGEHGEPILAIPDMGLSLPPPALGDGHGEEQRVPDKASENVLSDNSEHIVVDDDDDDDLDVTSNEVASRTPPTLITKERDEKFIIRRPKEEVREKNPSQRKKKRKGREVEPVEEPVSPVAISEVPPSHDSQASEPEPKPKPLSLEQYRRLRQKKKPTPMEKPEDQSTKWPSLPEAPTELPPIPCLQAPQDPRRPNPLPGKKEVAEVKPAWQPMGPGAPPTPEALLAPPAYMMAPSSKVASAGPQSKPVSLPQKPVVPQTAQSCQPNAAAAPSLVKSVRSPPQTSMAPAQLSPIPAQAVRSVIPFRSLKAPVLKATQAPEAPKAKSPTQELIESFTTEIGIEAADLTSLLEQFEETQAKVEQCVPEVSGRAAAVGNSSGEPALEKKAVERVRAHDLACSVVLTPPATPPHQMWKPLAPVALLGKSMAAEGSKPSPSKVIQIEARPLPSVKVRSKPTPSASTVSPTLASMDHDYCLPRKDTPVGETARRWNVNQPAAISFKPIERPGTVASHPGQQPPTSSSTPQTPSPALTLNPNAPPYDRAAKSSVLETPDASPARLEADTASPDRSPRRGRSRQSCRGYGSSRSPSPTPSSRQKRGRSKRRLSQRSPSPRSSDSRSSSPGSRSRSPSKKRYRRRHSESSSSSRSSASSSSSRSRSPPRRRKYSYSSSRSGSWSRSCSRSPQRRAHWRRRSRSSRRHSPSCRPGYRHQSPENTEEVKKRKEKAIEERRVVYVGRIRGTMTRSELKERFSLYGKIEECTLHFRDHGDNYGFVTYYDTKDAFTAIENGGKLRKPDELPFDLCFGGRRQFCRATYADLDSNREYDPLPAKGKFDALDFDTLLKQAQKNHKR